MTDSPSANSSDDPANAPDAVSDGLWPSADYHRQIERLRAAIGETLYLVELVDNAIQLAVHFTSIPSVLLGIIDFPRPDPSRGLTPHLILLDDGRGINLGRIARISRHSVFAPIPEDVLYLDSHAELNLLYSERRLSQDFIARRSAAVQAQILGQPRIEPAAVLLPSSGAEAPKDRS
jgi:hypothetical protein